jgi:hypothetical protein
MLSAIVSREKWQVFGEGMGMRSGSTEQQRTENYYGEELRDIQASELGRSKDALPPGKQCTSWRHYTYGLIGAEISRMSRYYDRVIQWARGPGETDLLLSAVDNMDKSVAAGFESIPDMKDEAEKRSIVLLNGTFNYELDIQGLLSALRSKLSRSSRVVVVVYNSYFAWIYWLANALGIRNSDMPCTFLTESNVRNLSKLAGYEVVKSRPAAYFPFRLFGFGDLLNKVLPCIPILKWLSLTGIITLRPVIATGHNPSLTIVIPARNERGNIEGALKRIPDMNGTEVEVIFVEGHSRDGTWEEIQRLKPLYESRFPIAAFKQTGKGKSDAVRLGFSKASKDLLVILDADLSMPPELLTRFYKAYVDGLADFVNGSRLVYPIEGQAMKFLNKIGNVFFAKLLSRVLGVSFGDTLCGTKLLSRTDYDRFIAWRSDFGDFDPFGDFELLFPAAILGLGIVDVPIRYRDRLYGETNISRFRHGLMLLKMSLIGFFRITLGQTR